MSATFDPLITTASVLQDYLRSGSISSVELVDIYLTEIAKSNDYLKAVITTAPRSNLIQQAKCLDEERSAGKVRSPLHGIPIVVKDNVATHPDLGMDTTAGSFALAGSRPRDNAIVVDKLIGAGALILGKTNLSELSYFKGSELLCGWSAVGGQGQSAYVRGGLRDDDTFAGHSNPGGSSSGPAIAVSAGYAPISIGTETEGSLVIPAGRAALYTIKATVGAVSQQGIVPISKLCDSAGPMAKSVVDLANLVDIMSDPGTPGIPKDGFASVMTSSWSDINVGVLDPNEWNFPPSDIKPDEGAIEQMKQAFQNAYSVIESQAKSFHHNVPLPNSDALIYKGESCLRTMWIGTFKTDFEAYINELENSKIHSLQELIDYNRSHADKELPPKYPRQDLLEAALTTTISPSDLNEAIAHARKIGRTEGVDKILKDYGIDVIIGPAESGITEIAAASGYPVATLPLGYLDLNGRPFALAALASAHQEAVLIKVQSAWEATFPKRQPPPKENFQNRSSALGDAPATVG